MSDSRDLRASQPHVALLPSSGMGHLTPFLRLAASLVSLNCRVTFITTHPTVTLAESQLVHRFLSAFPQVIPVEFHLLPFDPSAANSNDPFFLQFEAIRRSVHLLSPLLSSLPPPLSALITDVSLASEVIPATNNLSLPNYILFTSSAKMLSFCAHFPTIVNPNSSKDEDSINISDDLPPIPKSSIPPLLLNLTNLFTTQFISNGLKLVKSNGILINTFDSLEREWLTALNAGKVVKGLPPVITIGPLVPCNFEGGSPVAWLDNQPVGSVAYVSFGSRTTMSREQIRELGEGLEKSGCRFLWVVKDKKVDREDVDRVEDVVGNGFTERVKDKGLVVKDWVNQSEILSHKSVGGFVSHCGWNSVVEAALHGVRMLAWPQGGDQRINAGVVERSGLGLWIKSWGWGGGSEVVKAEEIGERVKEMMEDERLRMKAAHVREEAMKAVDAGGSSETGLSGVINVWKNTAAIM